MTRRLDASFHLHDRQIVGSDGAPAGKVDDLELTPPPDDANGPPRVTAIICRDWFRHEARIDFGVVKRIGAQIEVALPSTDLPAGKDEARVWDRIVSRFPGGRRHADT